MVILVKEFLLASGCGEELLLLFPELFFPFFNQRLLFVALNHTHTASFNLHIFQV